MSFLYSSTRNDMLQCFVCSPIPKVSGKKWATGQSVIRKEITSYRIGTLNSRFIFKNYKHTQKTDLKLFRRSIFFNPILQKNVIHLALFQPTFWERKKPIIIFFEILGCQYCKVSLILNSMYVQWSANFKLSAWHILLS